MSRVDKDGCAYAIGGFGEVFEPGTSVIRGGFVDGSNESAFGDSLGGMASSQASAASVQGGGKRRRKKKAVGKVVKRKKSRSRSKKR
jgi:hypothetical protein